MSGRVGGGIDKEKSLLVRFGTHANDTLLSASLETLILKYIKKI